MKTLLTVVETYKVDTEDEAQELINSAKESGDYSLTKYSSIHKEKKIKGTDDVDEWYRVSLTKLFANEKDV